MADGNGRSPERSVLQDAEQVAILHDAHEPAKGRVFDAVVAKALGRARQSRGRAGASGQRVGEGPPTEPRR
jgi:hypothetical protein